jgi:Ase1/PRC1/MAP65 family protein
VLARPFSLLAQFCSQLQELAGQLYDLWDLMDAPKEERHMFDHVTCNRSASVDEVTAPGALAQELIEQVSLSCELFGMITYKLFLLPYLTLTFPIL